MAQVELDNSWLDRLPIFWKRKVNNLIKKDRKAAVELFFETYRQGNTEKRLNYALIQLLPDSIEKLLEDIKKLTSKEFLNFINLLATPEFQEEIASLDKKRQLILLNKIYKSWPDIESNSGNIRLILINFNPSLSEELYTKISEESSTSKSFTAVEILKLWGTPILQNILINYLDSPKAVIKSFLNELNQENRIKLHSEVIPKVFESQTRILHFLALITPLKLEIEESNINETLFIVLNDLKDQVLHYLEFFEKTIEKYGDQRLDLLLNSYLKNPYESVRKILLTPLQEAAPKEWRSIIDAIIDEMAAPPLYITDIFVKCNFKTKNKIGTYIIKKSWLAQLSFLLSDFSIFQSALTSQKQLTIAEQALIDPYLYNHLVTHPEEIINLSKISYPKLAFASIADEKLLNLFINAIHTTNRKTMILKNWEELFLACSEDSLTIIFEKYGSLGKNNREYLESLLKEIIDLELMKFWSIIRKQKDISKYQEIIVYAFDKSTPWIGQFLSQLPNPHLSYIEKNVLPLFKSSGRNIIYSLLSIKDPSTITNIDEKIIERIVLNVVELDQKNFLPVVLIRCSRIIQNTNLRSFSTSLADNLFISYPKKSLRIIDTNKLGSLIPIVKNKLDLSDKKTINLIKQIIPKLHSDILHPIIVDSLLDFLKKSNRNLNLLETLLKDYERFESQKKYSDEGKNILIRIFHDLIGRSPNLDLLILPLFKDNPLSQLLIAPIYFSQISKQTFEKIILDPNITINEDNFLEGMIERLKVHPPEEGEQYFINLYQHTTKEGMKKTLILILAEYLSWPNLPLLIDLPEKNTYPDIYDKALTIFAKRYDIQTSKALLNIWNGGLRNIYDQRQSEGGILYSNCPQCHSPILENQKSCGFCTQRLTCAICMTSVVKLDDRDVVTCSQCGNLFHQNHLLESVKLQKKCPICSTKMVEATVLNLPKIRFFFK